MNIQKTQIALITAVLLCLFVLAGCGGGDLSGDKKSGLLQNKRVTDTEAINYSPLTSGGVATLTSDDSAIDGATLVIPPGAVTEDDKDSKITLIATSALPAGTPWGLQPVGSLFKAEPSELKFNAKSKAMLTLPIPPGGQEENLYVARWDEAANTWVSLGGSVVGDFISAEVDRLSLYGIFSYGKSLVRVENNIAAAEDPDNLGIDIRYISGPLPYPGWSKDQKFFAGRPLPTDQINLKSNESRLMMLSPGQYRFAVSYLSPKLITNELLFRIPAINDSQNNRQPDGVTVIDLEVVPVPQDGGSSDGNVVFFSNKGISRSLNSAEYINIQQTIKISDQGASSDNEYTNNSLTDFSGKTEVVAANQPPKLTCSANSQLDVIVSNRDPDAAGLPSRRIAVGPILNTVSINRIRLTGTALDPEDSTINYYWTWSGKGTVPLSDSTPSGREIEFFYSTKGKREGRYDVYLTAYDDANLFDECHWEVNIRGNEKPIIKVVSDYRIVDYGRFGDIFTLGDRYPLGKPKETELDDEEPGVKSSTWCDYIGGQNLVRLKSVELKGDSEKHVNRPTQYPAGMTCLFAMVGDNDDDPLAFEFEFPFTGSFYSAFDGRKISTKEQLEAYNSLLTSTMSNYPVPEPLKQFMPEGAKYALPIVWEAPDNISILHSDDASPTHDCRHYEHVDPDLEPCLDWGNFPDGGMTAIRARVTDGYSRNQTSFDWVGYGIQPVVKLIGISVEATDADAAEPTDGMADTGTFRIIRHGEITEQVEVKIQITGSATQGLDYKNINTLVTIPAGKQFVEITVSPVTDTINEETETVTLTILDGKGVGYLADNKSAQATVKIIDVNGADEQSLPVNTAPASLVLEGVYFTKTDKGDSDLCGTTQTCMRFLQTRTSPVENTEYYYFASLGTAEYRLDHVRENPTKILQEYRATFTFDQPPEKITAGATISLNIKGTAVGFSFGGNKRSMRYFTSRLTEEPQWSSMFHDSRVTLIGSELPWIEEKGRFEGTKTKTSTTKILIPEKPVDGFSIGVWYGWDPAIRIYWVYKLEK